MNWSIYFTMTMIKSAYYRMCLYTCMYVEICMHVCMHGEHVDIYTQYARRERKCVCVSVCVCPAPPSLCLPLLTVLKWSKATRTSLSLTPPKTDPDTCYGLALWLAALVKMRQTVIRSRKVPDNLESDRARLLKRDRRFFFLLSTSLGDDPVPTELMSQWTPMIDTAI